MADNADKANTTTEAEIQRGLKKIRVKVAKIPKGRSGYCELCGEWSGRLVNGVCASCRDKYKLK